MDVFALTSRQLCHMAAQDFEKALGGHRIEQLIAWEKIGVSAPEKLDGEALAGLEYEQRRAVVDAIQDIAMLPVYEKNTPQEREDAHQAIDGGVRVAKWRYMAALVNDAYGLGYDYVDLEMLSPLCAQLSTVERGATNQHMPTTHKLRHNPAVHSLHVAGLVAEICDDVLRLNPDMPQDEAQELQQWRQQWMRAAVVHDMGELKGELSVASQRKHLSAQELAEFEHQRGMVEEEVFDHALSARQEALAEVRWPVEMLAGKKAALLNDYSVAEGAEKFAGRVHKLVERMQSQQDYLRFEGRDMAPPLATVVPDSGYHKEFTYHYALDVMQGASKGVKDKAALAELVPEAENPALAAKLMKVLESKLDKLQEALVERMEYQPRSFAERFMEGVRSPSVGRGRG